MSRGWVNVGDFGALYADRIVLFTHAGKSRRYREDLDDAEIAERLGRPVDHASV